MKRVGPAQAGRARCRPVKPQGLKVPQAVEIDSRRQITTQPFSHALLGEGLGLPPMRVEEEMARCKFSAGAIVAICILALYAPVFSVQKQGETGNEQPSLQIVKGQVLKHENRSAHDHR